VLRTRVVSALILAPVVGLVVWAGGWPFLAVLLAVATVAGYEFTRMMRAGGQRVSLFFVLVAIALCFSDAAWPQAGLLRHGLAGLLIASAGWYVIRYRPGMPAAAWALTLAGGLYVGWLLAHFVLLRALPDGLAWVALALLTTWASDTGAYLLGRAIGRRKLCPQLSPGKTWEGLGGGLIGGMVAGAVIGTLAMDWGGAIGWTNGLVVGLLAAIVAPVGDLVVSMMKREVGVKDSGNLIPGHGGLLDRADSLMAVAPVVYSFAVWVGR
jgi:phosphatidate cytidylyltransferase